MHKKSVVLAWQPPMDDGGTPVTGYRIEYQPEDAMKWDVANEGERVLGNKYTVTGLREGRHYNFRVAAQNKSGVGEYASISKPVEVREPVVGDKPRLISGIEDKMINSPANAEMACCVKLGMDETDIRW